MENESNRIKNIELIGDLIVDLSKDYSVNKFTDDFREVVEQFMNDHNAVDAFSLRIRFRRTYKEQSED